jgi:hypothetical protein
MESLPSFTFDSSRDSDYRRPVIKQGMHDGSPQAATGASNYGNFAC